MERNQRGRLKRLSGDLRQPCEQGQKEGVELGSRPTQRIGGPAGGRGKKNEQKGSGGERASEGWGGSGGRYEAELPRRPKERRQAEKRDKRQERVGRERQRVAVLQL